MIGQRTFGISAALFLLIGQCLAQGRSFEVASIRIDKSEMRSGSMGVRGDRFVATNMTLRDLLMYAYRPSQGYFLDEQIIHVPDWAKVERFDIKAIPEGDAPVLPVERARAMLRSLLEERFQLKVHRETRDLPVYNLVLTKKGVTLSKDQTPPNPSQALIRVVSEPTQLGSVPRGELIMITGPLTTIMGKAISIPRLLDVLQGQSDRIIVDKTGFDKLIDVHLEFSQDLMGSHDTSGPGLLESQSATPNESGPSLFTAVREIGLRLRPGEAPVEALVVDSVQQPSEN